MTNPIRRAEWFISHLKGLENQPAREKADWILGHEKQLRLCIENLLSFQEGYSGRAQEVISLALKLLDAIKPLLSARGDWKNYLNGTAPRLRETYDALRERLNEMEK